MRKIKVGWLALFACALAALAPARAATTANLIVNGDAEAHRCTRDWTAQTPVPGWSVTRGAASVLCYSAFALTGETPVTPADSTPGNALFAAPGADTAMEQRVDISAAGAGVDRGEVRFKLSGWLGGVDARPERATLTAIFLDGEGRATGNPIIIADADAAARDFKTRLVAREAGGVVPPRTRNIVVTVNFISGMTSFQNAFADNIGLTLSGDVGALAPAALRPPAGAIPPLDHVYVLMMENTNYADVIDLVNGQPQVSALMPFLGSLAMNGVLLSNTWATYHPSDQNYVAMIAGDTFKFGPIYYPDFDLPRNHIGDLLNAAGKSWGGYVQHMNKPCNLVGGSGGDSWFAPNDEPFAQFKDVISDPNRCAATLRDLADFTAAISWNGLPNFAWLAADGWWDGEGAWFENFSVKFSLEKQDEFITEALAPLVESADWRNSRSIVIITWDETDGWGWPDNHVPTIVFGSPGLLKAGAVISNHYDGYGVLRTAELALGIPGLGRFDAYAAPMNEIFAMAPLAEDASHLWASRAAATRGSLDDTFGQSGVAAAVEQGQPLVMTVSGTMAADLDVMLEPLGVAPSTTSTRYRVDASGSATIPTGSLAPGFHAAWLSEGSQLPRSAPTPVIVLPFGGVTPSAPGVEILGAALDGGSKLQVKQGSNFIVRYCGRPDVTVANGWIGMFADGTPPAQMTRANANVIGDWLYTPGVATAAECGEAEAYPAELAPDTDYHVYLFKENSKGASVTVGSSAAFRLTTALPR